MTETWFVLPRIGTRTFIGRLKISEAFRLYIIPYGTVYSFGFAENFESHKLTTKYCRSRVLTVLYSTSYGRCRRTLSQCCKSVRYSYEDRQYFEFRYWRNRQKSIVLLTVLLYHMIPANPWTWRRLWYCTFYQFDSMKNENLVYNSTVQYPVWCLTQYR